MTKLSDLNIIDYSDLTPELARAGCLVRDMPNEAYHNYDGISKSGLDLISRSPAHYAFRSSSEPTRAMVIGSALHAAILEPDVFQRDYMLLKNVTDRRSSEYKEAVKSHGPDYVLTGKEAESIIAMQDAIKQNEYAQNHLKNGIAEIAAFAIDPKTGVLVKAKFDFLTDDLIAIDLKTTQDIRDFYKSVANYRYHVQDAFYSDVFNWATGEQLAQFEFLAIEKDLPCASKVFRLDTLARSYGAKLYREALNTYTECVNKNEWPMPDASIEYISLPSWASDPELMEY